MAVVFIKKVDFCSLRTIFTYELLLGVLFKEWGLVLHRGFVSLVRVVKRYEAWGLTLYVHNVLDWHKTSGKSGEAPRDSPYGEALTEPKGVDLFKSSGIRKDMGFISWNILKGRLFRQCLPQGKKCQNTDRTVTEKKRNVWYLVWFRGSIFLDVLSCESGGRERVGRRLVERILYVFRST